MFTNPGGMVQFRNPDAKDGFYVVKPRDSSSHPLGNEGGVKVYCRFEGQYAWMLVGTYREGETDSRLWANGTWGVSTEEGSPLPDDSAAGTTSRFPFSFWNDVSRGLPGGAITMTSTSLRSETFGAGLASSSIQNKYTRVYVCLA